MVRPIGKYKFHHLLIKLILYCLVTTFSLHTSSNANTTVQNENIDYQKILAEERQWAGLKTKTIRVGDVVWTYSEGGATDKPTLLLLHGLSNNRDSWNAVAHSLSQYYHLIIPSLPTTNETTVPTNFDYSVPHVTEHLRRFVEVIGIQKNLNIAGHSLGGTIAMFYASHYAYDTQSLLLVSSGGVFKNNNTQYLNHPIYLKQILVTQAGDLNYTLKKVMFNPPFSPSIIVKEQEKLLIAQAAIFSKTIDQLNNLNKLYTQSSYAKMAKNIEAPTFIIWGKQDQIVNVEVAQELKSMIKLAQAPVILNNVGHLPIIEAPEAVAEHYLKFLELNAEQRKSSSE